MKTPGNHLRNALKANAAFSLLSGITLILAKGSIAQLMNINNNMVLLYIGVGLLLFVASILHAAFSSTLSIKKVKFIIVQDWAWVVGSVLLLLWRPWEISMEGNVMIAVVAAAVAGFALWQMVALRKWMAAIAQ